jgi:hypothetical protein
MPRGVGLAEPGDRGDIDRIVFASDIGALIEQPHGSVDVADVVYGINHRVFVVHSRARMGALAAEHHLPSDQRHGSHQIVGVFVRLKVFL